MCRPSGLENGVWIPPTARDVGYDLPPSGLRQQAIRPHSHEESIVRPLEVSPRYFGSAISTASHQLA